MEKKVLCPYCGEEMLLEKDGSLYWFECDDCGAQSPKMYERSAAYEEAQERHQQPEERSLWDKCGHVGVGDSDEPLTLEQVQKRRGLPIWVEPVKDDADWEAHWNIQGDAWYPSVLCRRPASIKYPEQVHFLFDDQYGRLWVAYDWPPDKETDQC